MSNLRFNKIKSQTPISIIVHGGNRLGSLIAKTLVDQGSYVVIIDKFDSESRKHIADLKKSELVDFFDFKGFESLFEKINRFDYLYFLLDEKLKQEEFDSKEFLLQTKYLELNLAQTKKNNAKFSLVTSLKLNRELANRVNNEKLSTPSPYSNIELQKYCETMVAEYKDKTDINARIIRVGTLIGKGIERVYDKTLDTIFQDSTERSQITIKGEGLDVHNLIQEDDATYGILKLTFADNTKGEVISLANKNDYTTLSLAYKLLELNTEAQSIRFVDNPEEDFLIQDLYVPAPHASKYGWIQQVSLEEGLIQEIHNYYNLIDKTWNIAEKPQKKPVATTKETKTKFGEFLTKLTLPFQNFKKREKSTKVSSKGALKILAIGAFVALISYFLIYPILGTAIGLYIVNSSVKDLSQSLLSADTDRNSANIEKITQNIERISDSFSNIHWLFVLTGKQNLYNNSIRVILAAQNTAEGTKQLSEAIYPLAVYIREFKPAMSLQDSTTSTTREYREYLQMMESNKYKLDEASYKISLGSEILKSVQTNIFPKMLQDDILKIKDKIATASDLTMTYKSATEFIPNLLGANERKRYLIFLQNESELRSTGGWITSYGIIGVEGGQIREFFVDDIYNAEGTLKVQGKKYTAPQSMRNALGLSEWTFSLVNWSPDLSETRLASQQFVNDLGKGNKVDGIITMDISVLQKLLHKWGGIEVPGEDQLVTSENIYEKVFELHREFTPGSTQKTTFLANLANEIIKKLLSMDAGQLMLLGDVLNESFNEKHLQATFDNVEAFNFFKERNWGGNMDSRFVDAPAVVDWNWGGNKANQYLNKSHSLSINIKNEDTIDFAYTLAVENTSIVDTYPQGNYINYERVYIPPEAQVLKIAGITNNQYSVYKESGFKVIGGWFNVPMKQISTLEISYRLERSKLGSTFPLVKNDGVLFFDLDIFKQAGDKKFAYKLDVTYPSTWSLYNSGGLSTINNQLSTRFELNRDTTYKIVWNIPN